MSGDLGDNWLRVRMSREEAEAELHGQPPGAFLVHMRTSGPGFTLSVVGPDRILHFQACNAAKRPHKEERNKKIAFVSPLPLIPPKVAEEDSFFRLVAGAQTPQFPSLDALLKHYHAGRDPSVFLSHASNTNLLVLYSPYKRISFSFSTRKVSPGKSGPYTSCGSKI